MVSGNEMHIFHKSTHSEQFHVGFRSHIIFPFNMKPIFLVFSLLLVEYCVVACVQRSEH